jgi:hypothetical protein
MSEDKLRDAHMALKRKDKAMAQLKQKEKRLNDLRERVIAVRHLHRPTPDGRSCVECSRIICLGTPNGLGGMQYPCLTIATLDGFTND